MREGKIVVVGLGYVGLPLAVALSRINQAVVGFDIDVDRIAELKEGVDRTGEVDEGRLGSCTLNFTSDPTDCRGASLYIVTVPTPVDASNQPDLRPLASASRLVASLLDPKQAPIVVFESTVYPGVTEEICGPLIEGESGLVRGRDFWLGYSPERINPGDRTHRLENIVKVVAGDCADTLDRLSDVYGSITTAGVFRAASIKAAEAAKVIENAQRDINIAFVNEVAQIFSKLDISVWDVLDAASTKWNFLAFEPGLVGGHCIGVDPYYLSYRAQQLGHSPDVILAGRSINDGMGGWVADSVHETCGGGTGSVLVLGLTFKENVPDLRNSRVVDVIRRFRDLGYTVTVHDPHADGAEALREYDIELQSNIPADRFNIIFAAVPHAQYKDLEAAQICALLARDGCVADLKGIWRRLDLGPGVKRWSL